MRRGTARVSGPSWYRSKGAEPRARGRRSIGRCVACIRRCALWAQPLEDAPRRHHGGADARSARVAPGRVGGRGSSRVALQLQERSRLPDPNAHRRRSNQILRIGIQSPGKSYTTKSTPNPPPRRTTRSATTPRTTTSTRPSSTSTPPARPAPSSRSTTPATQRRSGSSKATRPKAAGLQTAPSTRKGTTGSPTGTARRSPMRSTSAKSK